MTRRAGLIGYPVAHSITPALQQAAFDRYGLDIRYEYWETRPEDLAARLSSLREPDVLGAQVTVPHKETALPYLDERVGDVVELGATNVLACKGGRLLGYNTDVPGFLRALEEDGRLDPAGKRVLLLGAGGAARAIALGLTRQRVGLLTIANRTPERARAVARLAEGRVPVAEVSLEGRPFREAAASADLIVNSTTLGMAGGPGEGQSPLTADLIPRSALVYDIVYNPPETPLLREARRAGARTLSGLAMLVYLGAEAFEIWTELPAPVEVMMAAAHRALKERVGR